MTIKSLFPASRPSLDLNFAKTKRLDPRITFSRSSTATYIGSDGLIKSAAVNQARFDHSGAGESLGLLVEEARTNSLKWSELLLGFWQYNNAKVSFINNSGLAPNGTWTASSLKQIAACSNNESRFYPDQNSQSSLSASTQYIYSFFAKLKNSASINKIGFLFFTNLYSYTSATSPTYLGGYCTFSNAGVVTSADANISYQDCGNGWYKISMPVYTYTTGLTVAGMSLSVGEEQSLAPSTYGEFLVWGAQLEAGSFPTSYIPTPATFTGRTSTATFYDSAGVVQTAASGVARSAAFFPDSSGVMRPAGLLLEAAGTNLVTYSEQFNQWSGGAVTITTNTTTAPDGTSTADKVIPTAISAVHYLNYTTPQGAGTFTFSVYAKAAGYPRLGVRVYDGAAYQMFTAFDVSAGTIVSNTAGTAKIESVGNGWYRCSCTGTTVTGSMGSGPAFWVLESLPASANAPFTGFTGDGTSGTFMWGAQIEASPYATSYIPTVASTVTRSADTSTSATVTRSADVAQITGTNFSSWYNQAEGTFFGNYTPQRVTNTTCWAAVAGSTTLIGPNAMVIGKAGGTDTAYAETRVNSITQYAVTRSISAGQMKTAYGARNGDHRACFNGTLAASGSGLFAPLSSNNLYIGGNHISTDVLNGTLSRLTYWPTRLPDATLQALTAS